MENAFLRVLDKHAPFRIKNVRNKSNVPWLTSSIKLQIRERDRIKLFALKNNSAYYWNAYKLSRNRVTQALREAKSAYYKRQFVSVANNPKETILSVISKVFEKLLYEQLYDYFLSNNLLSDRQFGFRQLHSTASTLLDSTNEWFINMDRGKINIAVFLDLQKACDTINHDILLKKLERYGMGSPVLNLLRNYLTDRTHMCSVNGVLSCSKTVTCGVPQGSILDLLFLIYINDLPGSLEFSSARMFADDTTLTASGTLLI